MRARLFCGLVLGSVCLGGLSTAWTSKVIAQRRARRPVLTAGKVQKVANRPEPVDPNRIPIKTIAEFSSEKTTVTTSPGKVSIEAKVKIFESQPSLVYMWTVLIRDANTDELVSVINYDRQKFSVTSNDTIRPTFKDSFPLAPGTYRVEWRLYDVTRHDDFSELNRSTVSHPDVVLSDGETVTVD